VEVQIASDKDDEIACLSNEIHERDDNICRLQAELDDATHATTKAEAEKASERIRVLELEKELEDAKNEASDSEGLSLEELEELKKTLCDGIETTFEKFRQARE
jgi:Skp family chaperone for outer membrane proteins